MCLFGNFAKWLPSYLYVYAVAKTLHTWIWKSALILGRPECKSLSVCIRIRIISDFQPTKLLLRLQMQQIQTIIVIIISLLEFSCEWKMEIRFSYQFIERHKNNNSGANILSSNISVAWFSKYTAGSFVCASCMRNVLALKVDIRF